MFRKFILTSLMAAGTLAGLTQTPASAEARTPWSQHGHDSYRHRRFEVLYLDCGHWKLAGTYRDRDNAQHEARHLRHRGFVVKIERS